MCKANSAACVIINTPRMDVTRQDARLHILLFAAYMHCVLILLSTVLFNAASI
jgi:hypothetical protein